MALASKIRIAAIFDQLRVLRESVTDRETIESEVASLRGSQTMDVKGAVHLSFTNLQAQICAMKETPASIAEATGEIPIL
ncbi:Uncharacterized protein ALO94_01605 [Pseudomonas syringae pv. spinaceae]|uniref:Uncharacterized protein n=1 Tax=Pseudomonas syringae pv. spinaceae TaxID=264459 RepID=A0A0N8SSX7_PSESX|nr:Uncharacterized protein ALO94_01605 [Pseudomonas syringae pv. spinaceae]